MKLTIRFGKSKTEKTHSVSSKELDTKFGTEPINSDTASSTYCNKDYVPAAYSVLDVGMQNKPDVTAKIS